MLATLHDGVSYGEKIKEAREASKTFCNLHFNIVVDLLLPHAAAGAQRKQQILSKSKKDGLGGQIDSLHRWCHDREVKANVWVCVCACVYCVCFVSFGWSKKKGKGGNVCLRLAQFPRVHGSEDFWEQMRLFLHLYAGTQSHSATVCVFHTGQWPVSYKNKHTNTQDIWMQRQANRNTESRKMPWTLVMHLHLHLPVQRPGATGEHLNGTLAASGQQVTGAQWQKRMGRTAAVGSTPVNSIEACEKNIKIRNKLQ